MSDLSKKPKPDYAPVYCAMYPELAGIARAHGYALAIHGSLARDFDLVCVPWTETPADPLTVIDAMCARFAIRLMAASAETPEKTARTAVVKLHGREVYTLSVAWGECAIDLSFMPRLPGAAQC